MNLVEINKLKEELVNSVLPSLDDIRDENKKDDLFICTSFVVTTNDEIECAKLALKEICSSNPDIKGRVDVFDNLVYSVINGEHVKGITLLLFLDKDKDRFDHPDINRFYVDYPEFFTGIFKEADEDESNQFIRDFLGVIISVKEKSIHFGCMKTRSTDGICNDFIPDIIDKVEREGLKCKAIEHVISNNTEYVYFFIYETECEAMNVQIQSLEQRSAMRLVK